MMVPASIRAVLRRTSISGNPPHSPVVLGFKVYLGRRATKEELAWLRGHGYRQQGRRWYRPDRRPARSAQPSSAGPESAR